MEENRFEFTPEIIKELIDHLGPVGKGTSEFIEQMKRYSDELNGTTPTINNYYCQAGHKTVTSDRDGMSSQKYIPCPVCSREARSVFYMCDQNEIATHEFYKPKYPRAFKKSQREAIRNGAMHIKNIWEPEPRPTPKKKSPIKITQ
jgi:hypothetical protein